MTTLTPLLGPARHELRWPATTTRRPTPPPPRVAGPHGWFVYGMAAHFGWLATGEYGGSRDNRVRGDRQMTHAFDPHAFDDCLDAVPTGGWEIRLLVEHDFTRELASTRDGSLLIGTTERGLGFSVANTRRGREAARFVHDNPQLRDVSAGGLVQPDWQTPHPTVEQAFIVQGFMLQEISLVRAGGNLGAWVKCDPW